VLEPQPVMIVVLHRGWRSRKDGRVSPNIDTHKSDRIAAVVFDIGETLVDETRAWSLEAQRSGVTSLTLFAALGALIERGEDHREVWALLGKQPPSAPIMLEVTDFYPDALPCVRAAIAAGLRVGLAGNQPESTEQALRDLGLSVDLIASSARWGVEKPDVAFFRRIADEMNVAPGRIVYVGIASTTTFCQPRPLVCERCSSDVDHGATCMLIGPMRLPPICRSTVSPHSCPPSLGCKSGRTERSICISRH
jgi:hypothetical protein